MKIIFLSLTVFTVVVLFSAFSSKRKGLPNNVSTQALFDTTKPRDMTPTENPYEGLKKLAYATKYDQLSLPNVGEKEVLYGVIMDWDYEGKAIITLVSFITGDASLYFSTGSGILGAGQHDDVNKVSKAFIQKAESLLIQANTTDTVLKTEQGMLKFYLLTNKGKYAIKDKIENVYNHTSSLNDMFTEANKLIAYIRMTEEKMHQ